MALKLPWIRFLPIIFICGVAKSCTFYDTPVPEYEKESIILAFVRPGKEIVINYASGETSPSIEEGILFKDGLPVDTFRVPNDTIGLALDHNPQWNSLYRLSAVLSDETTFAGHVVLPRKPKFKRISEQEISDSLRFNGLRYRQGLVIDDSLSDATVYLSVKSAQTYFLTDANQLPNFYQSKASKGDTMYLYSFNSLDSLRIRWHGAADYQFSLDRSEAARGSDLLNYQLPATLSNAEEGSGIISYYYDFALGL